MREQRCAMDVDALGATGATQIIQLRVTCKERAFSDTGYKIKQSTPLSKLMGNYGRRLGEQASQVSFMVHGKGIAPDDTAGKLGLADGDVVEAVIEHGELTQEKEMAAWKEVNSWLARGAEQEWLTPTAPPQLWK